jgi:hypothetical protein
MINNKRGQGLSTNAIILIILGIVVLVMLILGFTIGWSRLLPFLSKENVDSVVNGCVASCSQKSVYGFCTQERELIDADEKTVKTTCAILATLPDLKSKYGVADCAGVDCRKPCTEMEIDDVKAKELLTATEVAIDGFKGKYNLTSLAKEIPEGSQCWVVSA